MDDGSQRQQWQQRLIDIRFRAQVDGKAFDRQAWDGQADNGQAQPGQESRLDAREIIDQRRKPVIDRPQARCKDQRRKPVIDRPQARCKAVNRRDKAETQDHAQARRTQVQRAERRNAGRRRSERLSGAILELQPGQPRVKAAMSA